MSTNRKRASWMIVSAGIIIMLITLIVIGAILMYPALRTPPPPGFPEAASQLESNRQDIAYLRTVLREMDRSFNPDQWEAFDRDLDDLDQRAAELDAAALEMGLAAAVARSNNGHTNVLGASWGLTLNSLPLRFYWFSDGLYILKTDPALSRLLGGKVLEIAGRTPQETSERLAPYIGGNPALKRELAIHLMESPRAMHAAGLANAPLEIDLQVQTPDGSILRPRVAAIELPVSGPAPEQTPMTRMVDPRDLYWPRRELSPVPLPQRAPFPHTVSDGRQWAHVLDGRPVAFTLQDPNRFYWMADIDGGQTFYLQMNAAMDDPGQIALGQFLDQALEHVAASMPRIAIIDFRSNLGGSYQLPARFTRELPEVMPDNSRIYILTSANTYSAGVASTARLKYFAGESATIAGEPLGDYAQFWSEAATRIVLPNSGLRIGYGSGFHDWENGCSPGQLFTCYPLNYFYGVAAGDLEPAIPVSWSFADYLAGRDTVIDIIRQDTY